MNLITRSGLPRSGWFTVYFAVVVFSSLMTVGGRPDTAYADEPVSFSWKANPPEDYVLGYRIYYGSASRFDATGKPKPGFSYDYYIDSYDLARCVAGGNGTDCTPLSSREVVYTNLSGDVPSCTLYNLQGRLYFALTAYNTQAESNYSVELKVTLGGDGTPPGPGVLAALQQVNALLLKKKK